MVVFGQTYLYLGKVVAGKVVYLGQSGVCLAKVVIFGQSGFIWKKWMYSGKSDCIRVLVVVFGARLFFSDKVVGFGQK